MSDNHTFASYTRSIIIDESYYLDPNKNYFDYSQLLSQVLACSEDHDHFVKKNLGIDLLEDTWTWVITQNKIEVITLPQYGQNLEIKTQIASANRFFVERWFGIYHQQALMMTVYIQFAVIDLIERKMQTISGQILKENNLLAQEKASKFTKYKPDDSMAEGPTIHQMIQATDMDSNLHVNNLVYIRWVMKAILNSDVEFLSKYRIASCGIKYGSEIRDHQQVNIYQYKEKVQEGNGIKTFYQIVIPQANLEESIEACHMGIEWVRMANEVNE